MEDIISKTIKTVIENYDYNKISDKYLEILENKITKNIINDIPSDNPKDSDAFAKYFCKQYFEEISKINNDFNKLFIGEIMRNIHMASSDAINIKKYKLLYIEFKGTSKEGQPYLN